MAKVLVIGGGPGGLFAAAEAAEKGFEVILCEKGRIGENIKCAEGFFDVLKLLGKPCAGIRYKVHELIVKAISIYRFNVEPLYLWMLDRPTWQKEVAKEAAKKGVIIKENHPISHDALEQLRKQYDFIIDASGAPSLTSRAYGFSRVYKNNCGRTLQYTIEGDFSHLKNCFKVGLIPDLWGYYWIFPKGQDVKGKETANVGIANFSPSRQEKLQDLLDNVLKDEGIKNTKYKIVKFLGGICPTRMLDRLTYNNILLVGDAAGLTSPLHGGGIDMAILSGKEAAQALSHDLKTYERRLCKLLSPRLEFDEILAQLWGKMNIEGIDNLLSTLNDFKLYSMLYNPDFIKPGSAKLLKTVTAAHFM